jgi:hypothetical protein
MQDLKSDQQRIFCWSPKYMPERAQHMSCRICNRRPFAMADIKAIVAATAAAFVLPPPSLTHQAASRSKLHSDFSVKFGVELS